MAQLLVGKKAPSFTATAVKELEFKDVSLDEFSGKYLIIFFYSMDFTTCCASEVAAISKQLHGFHQRDCNVLGISCDSHYSHLAWVKQLVEERKIENMNFNLLSDKAGKIARDYGVYNSLAGISYRALFLIDKDQVVREVSINDYPVDYSLNELLQLIDAVKSKEAEEQEGGKQAHDSRGLKRTAVSDRDSKDVPTKSIKIENQECVSTGVC